MPKNSSPVFSQIMSLLHPQAFARCAARHPLRREPRGLTRYDHFLALCFAQLTHRRSLRDLCACLAAQPHYHLGFRGELTRTNLAYASRRRDWRLFAAVAEHLMQRARRLYAPPPGPVELPERALALDASLILLSAKIFPWAAGGRRHATAVKLNLLLSLRGNVPAWASITSGRRSDVKTLDELPVEPGCHYIMDRGYLDFSRLHQLHLRGGFFVVRSRRRFSFAVTASRPVDKQTSLRCDQTIRLANPHSRRGYPAPLRRVKIYDVKQHRSLALLTNQFGLPAATVAELYKQRWQVELFFKWIKQHLQLECFLGQSPNAVYCQLWAAVCTHLLLAILKQELKLSHSLYEIAQIISVRPFEQIPLAELLAKTTPAIEKDQNQNLFVFNDL
jgi:hypothetical protein